MLTGILQCGTYLPIVDKLLGFFRLHVIQYTIVLHLSLFSALYSYSSVKVHVFFDSRKHEVGSFIAWL